MVIQVGAILSVIVYFRHRLIPYKENQSHEKKHAIYSLWKKTIVGFIPALVVGGLLGGYAEELLFNPLVVSVALLVGGVILLVIERREGRVRINSINDLDYRTAFLIGLAQSVAIVPGTSRSAATIIGAMILGTSRVVAAEYSFFLAIPTLTAAAAYLLFKNGLFMPKIEFQVMAIGFFVSFITAWLVIAGFMSYVSRRDFKPFGYYRIVLGLILLWYFRLIQ